VRAVCRVATIGYPQPLSAAVRAEPSVLHYPGSTVVGFPTRGRGLGSIRTPFTGSIRLLRKGVTSGNGRRKAPRMRRGWHFNDRQEHSFIAELPSRVVARLTHPAEKLQGPALTTYLVNAQGSREAGPVGAPGCSTRPGLQFRSRTRGPGSSADLRARSRLT
jgi:hypothetical protein